MSLGRVIDFEREHDAERRALALGARNVDRAVHLLHEALHDGHSHAGALVVAACIAARLRERLENALEELLAHADARVAHHETVGHDVALDSQLIDGAAHRAA